MPKRNPNPGPRRPYGDPTDPHGLTALCQAYLDRLTVRNYSPQTIHHQLVYLNVFIKWALDRGLTRPTEITKPILERYQRWVFARRKPDGNPLAFATQANTLAPLRTWFRWLARSNHVPYNPASELELPKAPHVLPRDVLTAEEAEVVLAQPDVTTPLGVRDRAILETLYSTGMRRMEIIGLGLTDVDRPRGTVFVRQGKGKKDRVVPIGDRAVGWIDRYLQEVRPLMLVGDAYRDTLFLTIYGESLSPEGMSSMVGEYVTKAQVGKKGSCHTFRHTAATLMLENGADIRYIQVMLGHADLTTTQIYTRVSIKALKDVHTLTHPAKSGEPASKAPKPGKTDEG